MRQLLNGIRIAVLGGDDRELVLIPELIRLGAIVKVVGYPESRPELAGAEVVADILDGINNADAVILPMPGTDEKGVIRAVYATEKIVFSEDVIKKIPPQTSIFIGTAKPFLRDLARKYNITLIEIAEIDEIAILNSIPTAEGAVQIAMQELPITIHGSNIFILGMGRTGFTLAHLCSAMGAHTTIVARKPGDLARGYQMGFQTMIFSDLAENIQAAQIIYNTVPALVLTSEVLKKVKQGSLIVDLAAQPGGTDFQAAAQLGIKAILAPGLPGKVASVTAGRILAKVLPPMIKEKVAAQQTNLEVPHNEKIRRY
ncbi:MAG: dipicolinate synthase subunit DpsA [Bacillota bacterium]